VRGLPSQAVVVHCDAGICRDAGLVVKGGDPSTLRAGASLFLVHIIFAVARGPSPVVSGALTWGTFLPKP
jgi:hypothetical protein